MTIVLQLKSMKVISASQRRQPQHSLLKSPKKIEVRGKEYSGAACGRCINYRE